MVLMFSESHRTSTQSPYLLMSRRSAENTTRAFPSVTSIPVGPGLSARLSASKPKMTAPINIIRPTTRLEIDIIDSRERGSHEEPHHSTACARRQHLSQDTNAWTFDLML